MKSNNLLILLAMIILLFLLATTTSALTIAAPGVSVTIANNAPTSQRLGGD
jgi:hypothetical protein